MTSEYMNNLYRDLLSNSPQTVTTVSYTHLDVYKRQTSDGRKLGLDQRIINPMLPDEETTKVNHPPAACSLIGQSLVRRPLQLWHELCSLIWMITPRRICPSLRMRRMFPHGRCRT